MDAVVCGIDPGLSTTGYAVVRGDSQRLRVLDAGVFRFPRGDTLPRRLLAVEHDLEALFLEHTPLCVAVEELYSHYARPRTSILMGHARGVILLAAARQGLEVRSYPATRIKRRLTGNGQATKAQVQRAVQRALGLDQLPEPADLADALAIALCCVQDVRQPALSGATR